MDRNFNSPYNRGPSPQTPQPMQYFTSASRRDGTPTRHSGSSPHHWNRPPRVQHYGNSFNSPSGTVQNSSPYQRAAGYNPRFSPQPNYTPSPLRPRYGSYSTPRSFQGGRGGSGYRGARGRGGRFQNQERAPIESYFKESMLKDPWQGMEPFLMERTTFTTT